MRWIVRFVALEELEDALNELEQLYGPTTNVLPIITFIDESRIIISWRY